MGRMKAKAKGKGKRQRQKAKAKGKGERRKVSADDADDTDEKAKGERGLNGLMDGHGLKAKAKTSGSHGTARGPSPTKSRRDDDIKSKATPLGRGHASNTCSNASRLDTWTAVRSNCFRRCKSSMAAMRADRCECLLS